MVVIPALIGLVGVALRSRAGGSGLWDVLHELARGRSRAGLERERRATRACEARRRQGLSTDPHELPDTQADRDALAQRMDRLAILDAVRKLPRQQATAMALRLQFDYPLGEIAQVMGISTGSVKTHLHHARATLHTLLADTDGGVR